MIKEHVNKPNTPTWIKMNEDAQQFRWQDIFIRNFGGRFESRENRRGLGRRRKRKRRKSR